MKRTRLRSVRMFAVEGCARDSTADPRVSRAVSASPGRPPCLRGAPFAREDGSGAGLASPTVGAGCGRAYDTTGSFPTALIEIEQAELDTDLLLVQ